MKITIIGRGNIGGGLQRLWAAADHDVTTLGRDGGDVTDADVVVVAVPGDSIAAALEHVQGIEGKAVVDATNPARGRPTGFDSLAEQVKSLTNGPVAKAFNTNFGLLFDEVAGASHRPSSFYCGDDAARDVTEQLIRDAGTSLSASAVWSERRPSRTSSLTSCSRCREQGAARSSTASRAPTTCRRSDQTIDQVSPLPSSAPSSPSPFALAVEICSAIRSS